MRCAEERADSAHGSEKESDGDGRVVKMWLMPLQDALIKIKIMIVR